jgi:ribosome maturation factor RimP
MDLKDKVEGIVNEWVKGGECFPVEVKISPSRVAVYIDKPSGVSLQECASLSRLISDTLEPDGVWESHELEVSSPGMDQPLKVYRQYLRRIGREVRVITREGIEHKGVLQSADEHGFGLLESTSRKENKKKVVTETLHRFSYDQIKETKLNLTFKIK